MMISKNVKEFLEWSKQMDAKVSEIEQKEIYDEALEKFTNRENSDFVLQDIKK